jgi:hypothetical protein
VAKRIDEGLRIEDVLASAAGHRSGSGEAISTPRSLKCRRPARAERPPGRARVRSLLSWSPPPSARFAALSLEGGNRHVRETRSSRGAARSRRAVFAMQSVYGLFCLLCLST